MVWRRGPCTVHGCSLPAFICSLSCYSSLFHPYSKYYNVLIPWRIINHLQFQEERQWHWNIPRVNNMPVMLGLWLCSVIGSAYYSLCASLLSENVLNWKRRSSRIVHVWCYYRWLNSAWLQSPALSMVSACISKPLQLPSVSDTVGSLCDCHRTDRVERPSVLAMP